MRYFAHVGPLEGPLRDRDLPGTIGVMTARDQHLPAGRAEAIGPDADGHALFRLAVGGRPLGGLWLLVGREFVRARGGGRGGDIAASAQVRGRALEGRWRLIGGEFRPAP